MVAMVTCDLCPVHLSCGASLHLLCLLPGSSLLRVLPLTGFCLPHPLACSTSLLPQFSCLDPPQPFPGQRLPLVAPPSFAGFRVSELT